MTTLTKYDRTIERWITDVKTPLGVTCYMCVGTTEYESKIRAEFLIKALQLQIDLSDLNIGHHEAKQELPCRKK